MPYPPENATGKFFAACRQMARILYSRGNILMESLRNYVPFRKLLTFTFKIKAWKKKSENEQA